MQWWHLIVTVTIFSQTSCSPAQTPVIFVAYYSVTNQQGMGAKYAVKLQARCGASSPLEEGDDTLVKVHTRCAAASLLQEAGGVFHQDTPRLV